MLVVSKRQRYSEHNAATRRDMLMNACDSFRMSTRTIKSSVSSEFEHTKIKEMQCVRKLKEGCRLVNIDMSDNLIFRFACCCNFDYDLARTAIVEKFDDPHLYLKMEGDLLRQFESLVLFKLPGMKTRNHKQEVLYFRAHRHFASRKPTELLIKNMCYVLNDMSVTEEQCRNGVAFILDLDQFAQERKTIESVAKFLTAMEHQVPTIVETVLLINVPSWFTGAWKSLSKSAVSASFAKKFHFLAGAYQLGGYLMEGYEEYLPAELGFWRDSTEIVEDFIDKKIHDENETERGSMSDFQDSAEFDYFGWNED